MRLTGKDVDKEPLTFVIEGYNITNTYLAEPQFSESFFMDGFTGNLTFIPTNDWVGNFEVNFSVSDGAGEKDWKIIRFEVLNVNDDPWLVRVNEHNIVDHRVELTGAKQGQRFNFTVEASDLDVENSMMDELIFEAESQDILIKDMGACLCNMYNYSILPINDHAMMGQVMINVTLKDSADGVIDDWVEIYILVENTNDPQPAKV
jgi:hypothetical protein